MINNEWLALPERFKHIRLHYYVIMPNHFHSIIEIIATPLSELKNTPHIADIIGAYKSITTDKYIEGVKTKNWQRFERKLWQRNYWEHVIRHQQSFLSISDYIKNNPTTWKVDKLFNPL